MSCYGDLGSHLGDLRVALAALEDQKDTMERWGRLLAAVLHGGGRLLAAGNGGSAAQAQHLTAELVGRFESDRRPLSAIALHAETSSVTAIGNDFGFDTVFGRQVLAHGRAGDVLLLLSTSGNSTNLLDAARRGRTAGLRVWAMTGRSPNPLADLAQATVSVPSDSVAVVQEAHLVAVHALCAMVEAHLPEPEVVADHLADLTDLTGLTGLDLG